MAYSFNGWANSPTEAIPFSVSPSHLHNDNNADRSKPAINVGRAGILTTPLITCRGPYSSPPQFNNPLGSKCWVGGKQLITVCNWLRKGRKEREAEFATPERVQLKGILFRVINREARWGLYSLGRPPSSTRLPTSPSSGGCGDSQELGIRLPPQSYLRQKNFRPSTLNRVSIHWKAIELNPTKGHLYGIASLLKGIYTESLYRHPGQEIDLFLTVPGCLGPYSLEGEVGNPSTLKGKTSESLLTCLG